MSTKRVKYLSVAEVADRLRVGRMTVYRLMDREELGSVRVGRSRRVPEEEYERFLQNNYTGPELVVAP